MWQGVKILQFLDMQFTLSSYQFLCLMSRYFSWHPIPKTVHHCPVLTGARPSLTFMGTQGKTVISYIFKMTVLDKRWEDKNFRTEKQETIPLFVFMTFLSCTQTNSSFYLCIAEKIRKIIFCYNFFFLGLCSRTVTCFPLPCIHNIL
jgi:hypothetical protein